MAGEANQVKWVGVRPTNPEENIPIKPGTGTANFPVTESAPLTEIKILSPTTQQVFQHEPGPWAAVRSGVTRTQIIKSNVANNAAVIIHTVTTGKTLYISSASVSMLTGASVEAHLRIRNAADTETAKLLWIGGTAPITAHLACSFPMPIAVPEGYDVCIVGVTTYAYGLIQGWEE
jgi:hypothetical protein